MGSGRKPSTLEVGEQLGFHGESIRNWKRPGEIDHGSKPGVST